MSKAKYALAIVTTWVAAFAFTPLAYGQGQSANQDGSAPKADDTAGAVQPYLGLGVAPMHPALTAHLPEAADKGRGVLIEQVMEGSPAEKAGLKRYDILVRYDQQDLYSPEQLVKLVRNDQPGREVPLTYVRGGKIHETTVRLGETPAREPVRAGSSRPSLEEPARRRGQAEGSGPRLGRDNPRIREQTRRERQRQNDPAPWATFKSMTITKLDDGRYQAEIEFRDKDEKILHRDYLGTREEIREAIEQDEQLPPDEREHLLRSLDQQTPAVFRLVPPRPFRDFFEWDRELFNWPNLDF